jgi:pilus assembly protein CpaF
LKMQADSEIEPLSELFADPTVTEILINGPEEVWAERGGRLFRCPRVFSGEESLRLWLRRVLSERGRKVDPRSPFADSILPDGSRIHVAVPPISRNGICVSVRKFPVRPWTMGAFRESGGFSEGIEGLFKAAVHGRRNIFLSGATGSGKTSLLGALISEVPINERVIALEDVAELRVSHPHFLSLEARPPNQEGEGLIGPDRLLREALRMRPDRIVVGECRGPEALNLLLALNTGHNGSMGTIHANSPREALQRLETLALLAAGNLGELAIKQLILGGVHLLVHLERSGSGRKVAAVAELKGMDGGRLLLRDIALS